jgi:molybdate transport system substrate-binding protein
MRVLLVLLFALAAGGASAADLKLLTAGAYKPAAIEIVADFEKKTGHKVTIESGMTGAIQKRVAAGEYFDVVVIPPIPMAPFLGNRIEESSAKELARAGVGMAIKQGAPMPDISEPDGFKKALLAARAIAFVDPASGGSSGIYVAQLFQQMGIADQLKPRSVLVEDGLAAGQIVAGKADVALQQSSELMGVPGVQFVGPIPLMLQNYTIYSGGISVASRNHAAANALLLSLANPENGKILRSKGLDSP